VPACPRCGEDNPPHARFCLACGRALTGGTPREVRKTVTVVFVDITGSTGLGERLDPESLRRVMTRYFDEMRTVVERHGGTVEKFIGDAVMAVFGVPVLHEDDALRAVRSAVEMRGALVDLNKALEARWGVRLQVRTGVNTGEVVAGDPAAGESMVVGDAVNVAARLEQAAAPGEILIGASTQRLARDAVEIEAVEQLTVRGRDAPVEAYRLLRVLPGAPAFARRMDSPIVGRQREVAILEEAFQRVRKTRTCHLFTVLGSAGVGKSRLAAELVAACSGVSGVLSGRCLPYGEGITYWPVTEVIRQAAGLLDADSPEEIRSKLLALLEREEDGPIVAERLGQLLGTTTGGVTEEIPWAVRRFLEATARERPIVLILDDLHWGEPRLLDLIEYVADWVRDAPILLVCLTRPELLDFRPGWAGGKLNATSILLEPLTAVESTALISNLLGRAELAEDASRRITEASEGNPLFVEETLSMLIDDGVLRKDDGRWEVAKEMSGVAVPATIQALLAARLDRLGPGERAAIERAAVEGKLFHRGAVTALTPEESREPLTGHLQTLTRKELIRPARSEFVGEDAFEFRHLLLRDAAYAAMSKETRADLHARFAEWLARVAERRRPQYDEIVGYHFQQASRYRSELGRRDEETERLSRRAGEHLGSAGRRAFERGDVPAALNLLSRASDLLPESPERLRRRIDLGLALLEAGEFPRSREVFQDAADGARKLGEPALEWMARVELVEVQTQTEPGEADRGRREVEQAIATLEELGDDAGLAKAWHVAAILSWLEARAEETTAALERAVEHGARAGDRRQEAEDLALLTMTSSWGPVPADEGIRRTRQIIDRSRGHRKVEALAMATLSHLEARRGNVEEARKHIQEGRRILRELGLHVLAAATSHAAGYIELVAGHPEAAERHLRDGYAELARMGEKAYLSTVAVDLAEALYRLDELAEAESFTRISEISADPTDLSSQIGWRSVRAKVLARRGRLDEAERLARDAVTLAEGTDYLDESGDAVSDLAEVLLLAGRRSEARDALAGALDLYEQKGNLVHADRARRTLSELNSGPPG
jgi:class 3 adenylate cyclase/tetratricopeptide (TPR) repeat protein